MNNLRKTPTSTPHRCIKATTGLPFYGRRSNILWLMYKSIPLHRAPTAPHSSLSPNGLVVCVVSDSSIWVFCSQTLAICMRELNRFTAIATVAGTVGPVHRGGCHYTNYGIQRDDKGVHSWIWKVYFTAIISVITADGSSETHPCDAENFFSPFFP